MILVVTVVVIIITQLYENVSDVIDHPRQVLHRFYDNGDELGVSSVDNVSLAPIINAALNFNYTLSTTAISTTSSGTVIAAVASAAAAAVAGSSVHSENDTERDIPQIPAYIRTTSMVFCITIMLLGVIGNIMVIAFDI